MGRSIAGGLTLFAAIVLGCGAQNRPAAGTERGRCFPNATCDQGLTCLSNFCVRVPVDASTDTGPNSGTAGSTVPLDGGGGAAGSGAGGTGGPFVVAAHPPLPQVANLGGTVLTAPRIRPIFFVDDPDDTDIRSFLSELAAGSYWRATTAEYGVGALTLLNPVVGVTATAPTLSDGALQDALAANTSGPSAPWGPSDSSTIFLFVLPPSVGLTDGVSGCCTDFGGYHDETLVDGVTVPYAVTCTCPDFFGPGWNRIDTRTLIISHELIEAVTDPFPRSNPAFYAANQANLVWSMVTGGELADMCAIQPDMATVPVGGRHVVQRSWSNAAAALGNDPCVPAASPPYFNSMPVLDVVSYGSSGYRTNGALIPVGTSRTIDLQLFSTGAVPNGWKVGAYAYEDVVGGGTPSLTFSLDKTTGQNADILHLTITSVQSNPFLGGNPFLILSTVGSPGASNYRSHVAMGLVTTE